MKLPWRDKVGIAKATSILGCVFLISLGLCGTNGIAVTFFGGSVFGPEMTFFGRIMVGLGILSTVGMLVSAAGMLVVFVWWSFRVLRDIFTQRRSSDE